MIKYIPLLTLAACFSLTSNAQENIKYDPRIYKTWISLNNRKSLLAGVLYEIKDSSILISNSLLKQDYLKGNYKVTDINFKNIDHVSVRGKNSLLIGSIIGTAAGIAGAVGIAQGIARKDEFFGAFIIVGTPIIVLGTGIGALVGSFRVRIPINGSFEYFRRNERKLESYSHFREYSNGLNIYEQAYEHKWFIGLMMGPSIPAGDLDDKLEATINNGSAKTGGISSFILGYSIKEKLGISASFLSSSYNIKNSTTDKWWGLTSILAGPMFSFPVKKSLFLDLKPMIGYTNASLNVGNTSEKSGNGFGIYSNVSLRYNFSRRWCALVETGYLFSSQKFYDDNKIMQAINIGVGVAYRLK